MFSRFVWVCAVFVSGLTAAGSSFAADAHVIVATDDLTWTYKDRESKTNGDPLVVDDLKIGDIVEVQVPDSEDMEHGIVTIKPGTQTVIQDPVMKCGESPSDKPNAVLKEIGCKEDGKSNFGVVFEGTLKLEVLPTFKNEVPYWCVQHTQIMQGVLRLTTAPPD